MRACALCVLVLLGFKGQAATIEGTYDVAGTAADGTAYESRFIVSRAGNEQLPIFRLTWDTEPPVLTGIGLLLGNALIAATGEGCALSVFLRDPANPTQLKGRWIPEDGSTIGGGIAIAKAPVANDFVGEFEVTGGSLTITAIDGGAQLEWTRGGEANAGKGFVDEDGFLVSSHGTGECGVASYRLAGDQLRGQWAQGDVSLKGHEIATRRPEAEASDPTAQFELAMSYMHGEGASKDLAKAAELFRSLAEQGMSTAQFLLGGMYMSGEGVPFDLGEATKWLELAAEQNYADAYAPVGLLYITDTEGHPKDPEKALKWLLKAVDPGEVSTPFGQANKVLAAGGLGVLMYPQDPSKSYFWLSVASANPLSEAQVRILEEMREKLAEEEVTRIEAEASAWKAKHLGANP